MRIDFYLLVSEKREDRLLLACKLIEKAYVRGHKVFVYCNNEQEAHYIDELLWTFKDDSFIPHNLQGEGPTPPPPIQIGYQEPIGFKDILVNLSFTVPVFYKRFQRVMELVCNEEEAKERSRGHYKEYKKEGAELFTHPSIQV